jgi:hypothetical protein
VRNGLEQETAANDLCDRDIDVHDAQRINEMETPVAPKEEAPIEHRLRLRSPCLDPPDALVDIAVELNQVLEQNASVDDPLRRCGPASSRKDPTEVLADPISLVLVGAASKPD